MKRIQQNDREAFEVLMRRHLAVVLGMAVRSLGSAESGRRAAQDVFTSLWVKRLDYRREGAFSDHLKALVLHRCSDGGGSEPKARREGDSGAGDDGGADQSPVDQGPATSTHDPADEEAVAVYVLAHVSTVAAPPSSRQPLWHVAVPVGAAIVCAAALFVVLIRSGTGGLDSQRADESPAMVSAVQREAPSESASGVVGALQEDGAHSLPGEPAGETFSMHGLGLRGTGRGGGGTGADGIGIRPSSGRSRSRPPARPQNQPTTIDPNGRFATTYRPGRGHVARFEKALLQGKVPAPALELVAALGRGRGPEIAEPPEKALALATRPGLGKLPPGGGPVHLAIAVRSTDRAEAERPSAAVHLVMDTSGSMSGQAIEHARQAAREIIQRLEAGDRFSLTSYDTAARVVIPDGPVGPRRAQLLVQIAELDASGGTNLEAGLRQGYEQAQQSRAQQNGIQLVIVVSDGQPNRGVTSTRALSEFAAAAFQQGVETTTIGVGGGYDPRVMSAIAEYGAGGYYYLPDGSAIQQVVHTELDVRCHPVARGVEIRVRLGTGVELLEAYGSRRLNQMESQRVRQSEVAIDQQVARRDGIARDRDKDVEGGMRFFIPGFARADKHTILLRLRVPSGAPGRNLSLAEVDLRYKDRVSRVNQHEERRVSLSYGRNNDEALASFDEEVRRTVFAFRTGQVLLEAASQLTRGYHHVGLAHLYERAQFLRHSALVMNDGILRADAERLDRFRGALADRSSPNTLLLGSVVQRAGNNFMR